MFANLLIRRKNIWPLFPAKSSATDHRMIQVTLYSPIGSCQWQCLDTVMFFLNLRLSRLVNQYNAVQLTEADADLSINWLHLDITCRIYSHFYARTGQLYFCYVVVQLTCFWASLMVRTGVPEVSCVKGHLVGLLYMYVLSIYGFSHFLHGAALFKLHWQTVSWDNPMQSYPLLPQQVNTLKLCQIEQFLRTHIHLHHGHDSLNFKAVSGASPRMKQLRHAASKTVRQKY